MTNKKLAVIKSCLKASLILQFSLLFLWACDSSTYDKFEGPTQGTSYHVTAQLPDGVRHENVQQIINKRLEDIDRSLSTYRQDSEISRFNELTVNTDIEVSEEFIEVLDISREVYRDSGGVFDPTIKPLIDLWGFGSKVSVQNFERAADEKDIAVAKLSMNFPGVVSRGRLVRKLSALTVNFNGVAQGYTVDVLKKELNKLGIHNYMIEVGGEVATKGVSSRNTPWRIGVENPEKKQAGERVFSALLLNDANVSTSGDYRNYYEIDGKRYSHTLDPRTGRPVSHKLASVTVVTQSVGHADAWCTALMVLGEHAGFDLAEKLGMAAYFIYRKDNGFAVKSTRAMRAYLEP